MQPILVRPVDGGSLRDHRRRTALARLRSAPGSSEVPALVRDGSRPGGARAGADRKHPARGSQSARGSAAASAPDRRVRPHARSRGAGGRPLAQRGDEPAAAARAREARAGVRCSRAQLDMGHARALLALAAGAAGRRRGGGSSRRVCRCARPSDWCRPSLHPGTSARARSARARRCRPRPPAGTNWRRALGAPVRIEPKRKGAGRIVIGYSSLEQLDGILAKLRDVA